MRKLAAAAVVVMCLAAPARAADGFEAQTTAQLEAGIEAKHPASYMMLAAKLFQAGRKDEAVFWFYLGQLRYRTHLAARPSLDPSGDRALFSSLFEVVGRPVNQYAFADISRLTRTLDEVLAWDDAHPDGFTPKERFAVARQGVRKGLVEMRQDVLARTVEIRETRTQNGLDNR
jgi:hypothetical protein